MKKPLYLSIILTGLLILFWAVYQHQDVSVELEYRGSKECASCHQRHYDSWQTTLHPKMFHPVTDPNQIMGDFSQKNPLVTFKKEEIEYVVGSKWEQVYVRMIEGNITPSPPNGWSAPKNGFPTR